MPSISAKWVAPSLALLLLTACSEPSQPAIPDAQSIHRDAITIDAHADIELPGQPSSYVGSDGLSKVSPAKMRSGGLDAVVMSIAVGPKPRTAQGYAEARQIADTELAAVQAPGAAAVGECITELARLVFYLDLLYLADEFVELVALRLPGLDSRLLFVGFA